MRNLRTPLIKARAQGGTFYTFGSALEDVGLNINELNNKVALSHYVILNITPASGTTSSFTELLQNYALNMETVIRNQPSYNFAEKTTVSERVFWKFMKKYYGFSVDASSGLGNSNVVKGFGAIAAGAQRTDAYGIYNETYVQIPSSYRQTPVLFKSVDDYNYKLGATVTTDASNGYIENIPAAEIQNDKIIATDVSAVAIYDSGTSYNCDSNYCVEFSLNELRKYYNNDNITYDDIAIASNNQMTYQFNAILVYYSIYDGVSSEVLSTNAYGILLLNPEETVDGSYIFPTIEKKASDSTTIGNSYSFRLNIKTTSTYSGNVTINDNSTGGYEMSLEFNDMLKNLGTAVDILKSNNKLISTISSDYLSLKEMLIETIDKIDRLEETINGRNGIKARLQKLEEAENEEAVVNTNNNVEHTETTSEITTNNSSETQFTATTE